MAPLPAPPVGAGLLGPPGLGAGFRFSFSTSVLKHYMGLSKCAQLGPRNPRVCMCVCVPLTELPRPISFLILDKHWSQFFLALPLLGLDRSVFVVCVSVCVCARARAVFPFFGNLMRQHSAFLAEVLGFGKLVCLFPKDPLVLKGLTASPLPGAWNFRLLGALRWLACGDPGGAGQLQAQILAQLGSCLIK